MDRNKLIAYAIKYDGEYNKILKAIKENEDINIVSDDSAITIFDSDYPKKLFDLKYPPFVLFYKGNIKLLKEESISIVGSRLACDYALKATKGLCFNNKDKVIISGLAKGIDTYAHLSSNKTIGILGCGINYVYPYCNYDLYRYMSNNQLIISEYPNMCKPLAYHFPFRNRIIAALANKVYIMQSKINSGTMTTVNEALELGKEIRILPYDIFNKNGLNNNKLIYEGGTPILYEEIAF